VVHTKEPLYVNINDIKLWLNEADAVVEKLRQSDDALKSDKKSNTENRQTSLFGDGID